MAVASELITRMPAIASIRASVLIPLVQQMDKKSGKTDLLLAGHGILRSQLDDPYSVVPMARYVALFEDAARMLDDPFFGARMGMAATPADVGPMGVLFSISPTIKAGFERMSKFVNSLQGATSSGLIDQGDAYVWSYRLSDAAMWPRRQDSEFSLAATCQLTRACFHRSWRPVEIHFEHRAPRNTDTLERIFRAPILFGQSSNRIITAKADAERLYRMEDRAMASMLERLIADLVDDTDHEPSVTEKVTALIGIYLGHKPISVPALATELGMSARTLQRRLAEDGTSLRALVRDHRQTLTQQKLADNMQKSQIAEALGYADSTVFWRAARGWRKDNH